MKNLFLLGTLLTGSMAFANPFDAFIGNYALVGSPTITGVGVSSVAQNCIRFNFANLTSFSVVSDTTDYATSDMLHFNYSGTSGFGWSGHPIMDYNDGSGMSYAQTTGDSNYAQNTWVQTGGSVGNQTSEPLTVSLQRSGSQVLLKMVESYIENSQVVSSCTYQATLIKN